MKTLKFTIDHAQVQPAAIQKYSQGIFSEIDRIQDARVKGYDSVYAPLWVPEDGALRKRVHATVDRIQKLQPAALVVIGIGGSNLGTRAIDEALRGSCAVKKDGLQAFYADTVDPDLIGPMLAEIECLLSNNRHIILNVISKSGTTTETIANFEIFLHILKQYHPTDYQKYVVVTTDKNSPLYELAREESFTCLEIPQQVGGRFSVMSAVGLFPLAMLGIAIDELHAGACDANKNCLQITNDNYAAQSAAVLFALYECGYFIHNFFPFSVDLHSLGLWYRQLTAESLGKETDRNGNQVNVGITPTVSVGSTDLHSIVELHLGGPRNTVTTFVDVQKTRNNITLPNEKRFDKIVAHLQGKSLSSLMDAMIQGTERAYTEQKRPFMLVEFPEKNAWTLGWFMQWKMVETIFLGHLFNINPFVQPQVELYKKETRAILANE